MPPASTPVPSAPPVPEGDEMAGPGPGAIFPIVISELSDSEQSCLRENTAPERLESLLQSPDLATPEEATELIQCLEDDTLLNFFLAGLIGQAGSLSDETSVCISAGFQNIDISAMMLSALTGAEDEAAAMIAGMAGMFLTLSCLNDEEWEAVAPALDMGPDDRESLQCLLAELGGPEGLAALLDPAAGPPMALFGAAMSCGLQMDGG